MGNEQELRKHLCEAVDKIEDFEVDKKCINEDIRKIYSNAERHGVNVYALKRLIMCRKNKTYAEKKNENVLEKYMTIKKGYNLNG
ncbi:GapR family DNA-binding domain-containing protein [Commensalibacter sp. W8163]|nr:GapR family DNA-binding domain-containing protein [Commensalibacter sp. W8163]MBI0180273.1 DUF2312 domain-containing protein [Commensalibacter sp. W8163]